MRRMVLILILAATAALAQNPTKKTPAAIPAKATERSATSAAKSKVVAPTEAVMTIHGLCDRQGQAKQGAKASACATVLTRRDFEAFVDVLNATSTRGIDPVFYRAAAEGYTSLLVTSKAGQKAGVDKDPRFEQIMEVTRMRAMGEMYRVKKFNEALNVPAKEIEAIYKKNIAGYEEVDLDRFQLPKNNPANLSDEEFRAKAKRVAEELRARAAKGEEISKLEKEGLEALGQGEKTPVIAIGLRRGQFQEKAEKEIFALGPGQVTSVLDAGGLWMFFKRTGRLTLPLDLVRPEIRTRLFRDKLDMIDRTLHDAVHVDYNEAYFGPSPTPAKADAGKSEKAEAAKSQAKPASPATVAPSATVMTIHGLCGSHKQEAATSSCTLRITKQQFETVMKVALLTASKGIPSPRSIAEGYLDVLIYGQAGERAGIEKDAHYPEVMKLSRKRALTDMYRLKQDEKAREIPAEEIEAYYKKNIGSFEEVKLSHISVPREKPATSHEADFGAKAKRLASKLRERAAKGEDMDKLQKAAYEALGIKEPPATLMSPIRKGALEETAEREVFGLKPGEVTSVREFPPAYVIYKLESRRTIPLEEVKPELSLKFYRDNLEKLMKAPSSGISAEYNEKYFAPAPSSAWTSAGTQASASHKPVAAK